MPEELPILTLEQIEELRRNGADLQIGDGEEASRAVRNERMSGGRAALATLKGNAGGLAAGGLAGLGGWSAGAALAPETGGASLAIPLIASLVAGTGGSYAGQKAQEALTPEDTYRAQQEEARRAMEEHPVISTATQLGAGAILGGGRPSIRNLRYALGGNPAGLEGEALANMQRLARANVLTGNAINVGAQTGVNAAQQVFDTGTIDPLELAKGAGEAAVAGSIFTNPNWLGRKLNPNWKPLNEIPIEPVSTDADGMNTQSTDKHDEMLKNMAAQTDAIVAQRKAEAMTEEARAYAADQEVKVKAAQVVLNPSEFPDTMMVKNFKQLYKKVSPSQDFTTQAENRKWNLSLDQMTNEQKRQLLYIHALENVDPAKAIAAKQQAIQDAQYVEWWKGETKRKQEAENEAFKLAENARQAQQEAAITRQAMAQAERQRAFEQGQQELFQTRQAQEAEMLRQRNLEQVAQGQRETEIANAQAGGLATPERIQKTNLPMISRNAIRRGEIREGAGTASRVPVNVAEGGRSEAEIIQDRLEQAGAKFAPEKQTEQTIAPAARTFGATPVNDEVAQHIVNNKADVGSVLTKLSADTKHPYAELAKQMLAGMDERSRKVKIQYKPDWSAQYSSGRDKITVGKNDIDADTTVHEIVHAATIRKAPDWMTNGDYKGKTLKEKMDEYLVSGDNEQVKELIDCYYKTAEHLGMTDTLFGENGFAGRAKDLQHHARKTETWKESVAYGMGDFGEYIAQALSSREFQHTLNTIDAGGGKTLWTKFVTAIKNILGLDVKAGSMLERVLSETEKLSKQERPAEVKDTEEQSIPIDFYSPDKAPDDFAKYNSLNAELTHMLKAGEAGSEEFSRLWKQMEELKNKHGGMPPAATDDSGVKFAPSKDDKSDLGKDIVTRSLGRITEAANDAIARNGEEGKRLASAIDKTLIDARQNTGKWWTSVEQVTHKLTQEQLKRLDNALYMETNNKKDMSFMLRSAGEREAYNVIRKTLKDIGDYRLAINEPVIRGGKPTEMIQDPYYYPTTEELRVGDILRQNKDQAKIAQIRQDYIDQYVRHNPKEGVKGAEFAWNEFLDAHQGSAKNNSMPSLAIFNAMRKQAGTPLPNSLRRTDLRENMFNYIRRAAMDTAHYKNIESDHPVAASLGYNKDAWGNDINREGIRNIHGNNAVHAVMREIRGEIEPLGHRNERSVENIANALILGPLTEIHKMLSSISQAVTYTDNPLHTAKMIVSSVKNLGSAWLRAKEGGVTIHRPNDLVDFTSAHLTFAERANALANSVRKIYTLNGLTEKFTVGMAQASGEYLLPAKLRMADAGDAAAQRLMKWVDPAYEVGKSYSKEEMSKLASTFATMLHGTRDARTLPEWLLRDGEVAAFFKLLNWNIAQTNNFFKHVWKPATEGNLKPLLMTTFGASLGGLVIKELREKMSGKPGQIPSLAEIASSSRGVEGNLPALAYNWIAAAGYGGLGGIVSLAAKYPFDIAYRNNLQGAVFPLDEVVTAYSEVAKNVADALINDPTANPLKITSRAFTDIITKNTQIGRVALNQLINAGVINEESNIPELRELAFEKGQSEKLGQLKRFKQVEGLPVNPATDVQGNPYLGIEGKEFKHTQDFEQAVKASRKVVSDLFEKYGNSPEILMSKLEGLKANPYTVFPSIENSPMMFSKYLKFLENRYGEAETNKILADYMKRKAINEAKGGLIPA